MVENPILVRFEIKQPKVKEELEGIISSMEGFELDNSGSALACDLLILEVGEDLKKEFQLAHNLLDSGMAREIFFTSSRLDQSLMERRGRTGKSSMSLAARGGWETPRLRSTWPPV